MRDVVDLMPGTGEPLDAGHRDRLRAAGAEAASLDEAIWRRVTGALPPWWSAEGNTLYLADGAWLPDHVMATLAMIPMRDVLVAIGSPMEWLSSLLVGGDSATVFVDRDCVLTAGEVYCGGGSQVVLHGPMLATRSAIIDARNGGSIVTDPDQLWAADVYIATDDMHRLEDRRTGERINSFGAHIRIGEHVWLGRDVVITGHVEIGEGAVVGMRSLVRGQKIPPHVVAVGSPARVVREDFVWTDDDLP